jgi:DNA-binding SARP family transcriptional activator
VTDAVWGAEPPASARNAMLVYVSALRKALRPFGVDIERAGDGYVLRGDVRVDTAEFEQLVSKGRAALRTGHFENASAALEMALSLWTGTPMRGLDEPPFEASRSALEALYAAARNDSFRRALTERFGGLA